MNAPTIIDASVYAAVALRFGTTLVTLDREQLERFDQAVSPQ